MKKSVLFIVVVFVCNSFFAQGNQFLVFEFMKVANEQELSYMETENFWQKIHAQRVKNKDILGWDLWSLQSPDETKEFQYLTVSVFDNASKMFTNSLDFGSALKDAYPNMSDEDLDAEFIKTDNSRELAMRLYSEIIKSTTDNFSMNIGTVASIEFMKSIQENGEYENAELGTFYPLQQKAVDLGEKGNWSFIIIFPTTGKDMEATHITISMYKGIDEYLKSEEAATDIEMDPELTQKIDEGLKTRDIKDKYVATLIKKIR